MSRASRPLAREGRPILSFKRSTHFRMALWYTALLGLVSIAFAVFVFASQLRDIYGESRFRILKDMDEVGRAFESGGAVHIQGGDSYAIFDSEGKMLKASDIAEPKARDLAAAARLGKADDQEKSEPHGKPVSWTVDRGEVEMLYGYAPMRGPKQPLANQGTLAEGPADYPAGAARAFASSYMILYGSQLDPYGLRGRLVATLLIAIACMLALALLGGLWLADRAMRPVAQIARSARSIGEGDLSRRIRLGTRDELGELSDVFDAMLDRLEAAFERQKRFVADAGHELRTPLSIISLESGRALSSERKPEEYRQSLATVRTECGYMAKLVDELLVLARADSCDTKKSFALVDLSDVALEDLERFAQLAAGRRISLSADELPEVLVRGDRAALATAVGNLIDNAVKYGRPGGRVVLSLSAGAEALLVISDDGPGIPAEKLGRVFDRFFRVDDSRSEEEGAPSGSGLGLAIVKAVVESHGGRVSVASEIGRGSAFSIALPLARESEGS